MDLNGERVDVNMDNVAHVAFYNKEQTHIHFIGESEPLMVKGTIKGV
jgi:hypothetical protein